jgi:hypothetical protein
MGKHRPQVISTEHRLLHGLTQNFDLIDVDIRLIP